MKTKAQWMMSVSSMANEQYRCVACNNDYQRGDVESTWKCPECVDEYVRIYAEDTATGAKIALSRKAASEVQVDEWVHFPHAWSEPYQVAAVRQRGDLIGIALLRHSEVKLDPNRPVNINEGSW